MAALMSRFILSTLVFIAACSISTLATATNSLQIGMPATNSPDADQNPAYATRADAMQAADDIAQRLHLDDQWVRDAIGQAQYLPSVARLMLPAPVGTAKNWQRYRSRFVEPIRIRAGVRFWQENREALRRAQQDYGVPPEIIVGILGVETVYGQQMGNFRVIDALATLAFDYPGAGARAQARSAYFRSELEQFLLLTSRTGTDPLQPLGSYAGAMGMPQFMPSNWTRFGVDFDGTGKVDLVNSAADAIGSVANYLYAFGWHTGMPATYPVSFDTARLNLSALLAPDILPTFSVAGFLANGAVLQGAALQNPGPLALIELENGDDGPSYVAGTENFYVITRYNHSSYYAMAVLDLGNAVAAAVAADEPNSPLP